MPAWSDLTCVSKMMGLDFDPNSITPDHLGIAIMRERASSIGATLKIKSQVGEGTTVELDWNAGTEGVK
jgi:nitrate/nitrite-specific signal transduction histidine kinase